MTRSWIGYVLALVAACGDGSTATPPPVAVAPKVDASDLIEKFQCARCHAVPGAPTVAFEKQCVGCHQQILDGTFAPEGAPVEKWKSRIHSLRYVPSLAGADRLRRAWIREFLRAPHDVRPELIAEMPRLAISEQEAERLAAHLAPGDDPAANGDATRGATADAVARTTIDARSGSAKRATSDIGTVARSIGDAARGEQLYRSFGCARCHRFGGAGVDDPMMHGAGRDQPGLLAAWTLAPDLRHARARMQPARMAEWIVAPRGAMPKLGVEPEAARDLAAFIATTPLAALPKPERVKRLPLLARAVTWDEVQAKVFKNVCWHCHAVPDFARGDGGPGNSGGFGFAPRGLDVSTYSGISAGSLDDAGERRSVFAPLADGTPRIVAHLLARHAEAAGEPGPVRGMPLGLPPLPLEEIQLVDSWIAQGRPR